MKGTPARLSDKIVTILFKKLITLDLQIIINDLVSINQYNHLIKYNKTSFLKLI